MMQSKMSGKLSKARPVVQLLLVSCVLWGIPLLVFSAGTNPDALLATMQRELQRASAALAKSDPAPYFVSYSVSDFEGADHFCDERKALLGLLARAAAGNRLIGNAACGACLHLDNTHGQSRASGMGSGMLPLDGDADATARVLWEALPILVEKASSAFVQVKTRIPSASCGRRQVAPDFSRETPQNQHQRCLVGRPFLRCGSLGGTRQADSLRISQVSGCSNVVRDRLRAGENKSYSVNTEGTEIVQPATMARLVIEAETRAEDGMDLLRVETFQGDSPNQLPSDSELLARVQKMAADVKALRTAPVADAYAGPALLSGRAAAVFFS